MPFSDTEAAKSIVMPLHPGNGIPAGENAGNAFGRMDLPINKAARQRTGARVPAYCTAVGRAVREPGYAVSDQDTVIGVRVVASPIFDAGRRPWAAITPAAPIRLDGRAI